MHPPSHAYDRHRCVWGSGGLAPLILNLSTKLWAVTRLTLLPLYSRTKRSVGPRAFEILGERRNLLLLPVMQQ